jgi:hypothetical protein
METKTNVTKSKCSDKCWNCSLRGSEQCPKNKAELKPIKNSMRVYSTRWNRRLENSLSKRLVLAYNQRLGR